MELMQMRSIAKDNATTLSDRRGQRMIDASCIHWGDAGHELLAATEHAAEGVLDELLEDAWLPPLDDVLLDRCTQHLFHRADALRRLSFSRGIDPATAAEFGLGLCADVRRDFGFGAHESRLVIPICDQFGRCRNVGLYNSRARPKMLRLAGRRVRLFPESSFFGFSDQPFILCEGELDAILGRQEGLRTVTAGSAAAYRVYEKHLDRFAGARIRIAFDNDEEGRRGAKRLAALLRSVVEEVLVVRIPLEKRGADLTDWIIALRRRGTHHAA